MIHQVISDVTCLGGIMRFPNSNSIIEVIIGESVEFYSID